MLQTSDGGQQWVDRSISCVGGCKRVTDFLKIRFIDSKTGWTVGEGGALYSTADAGITWLPHQPIAKQSLFGLSFADSSRGWAVGENGTILNLIP
jgi:photosystem II stability/assembly factor-like uncharacterized protein